MDNAYQKLTASAPNGINGCEFDSITGATPVAEPLFILRGAALHIPKVWFPCLLQHSVTLKVCPLQTKMVASIPNTKRRGSESVHYANPSRSK